jgi:hypothetical protein
MCHEANKEITRSSYGCIVSGVGAELVWTNFSRQERIVDGMLVG